VSKRAFRPLPPSLLSVLKLCCIDHPSLPPSLPTRSTKKSNRERGKKEEGREGGREGGKKGDVPVSDMYRLLTNPSHSSERRRPANDHRRETR